MDYSDLVDDVVSLCPNITQPVVMGAISEAVRIFCKESTAYRKKLTSSDLSYSNGVYTINEPYRSQIDSVISPMVFDGSYTVYSFSDGSKSTSPTPPVGYVLVSTDVYSIESKNVQGASPEWLDINQSGWRSDTSDKTVNYFCMLSEETFVITPDDGTDRSSKLTVSLVLLPTRTTTYIDNDFGNRWFYALVAGARYLCMAMPSTPWVNPDGAAYFKSKFEAGIEEARKYIKTGLRNPQADGINHVKLHYR